MSKRSAVFILFLAALAGTANAGQAPSDDFDSASKIEVSKTELINVGGWKLESATNADGSAIAALLPAGADIQLAFELNGMLAKGACNEFGGTYRAGGGRLEAKVSAKTLRECDTARIEADRKLGELLATPFKAELRQTQPMRMRLRGKNGEVLMFSALPIRF